MPSDGCPQHLPPDTLRSALDEQTLRASDAIIEISADAIITIDDEQRIIRFNHGAEDIFGYSSEEILGQKIDILIPGRFRARHPAQIRGFAESPVVARRMGERRQISGLRKDGEEFPAEASISKTQLGDRWIFTVALRDVTERVRAERGQRFLAEATALLSGSLESAQSLEGVASLALPLLGDWCVILLRTDAGVTRRSVAVHAKPDAAPLMQRLLALPFGERAGHPLLTALEAGQPVLIEVFDADVMRSFVDSEAHAAILRDLAPRSMVAAPMRARDRTVGVLCFFRGSDSERAHDQEDVELAVELARRAAMALDNARLYAEANAAVHARDDVLAVVSHDLGNPLAAIRLCSTVLHRMLSRDASAADALVQVDNIRSSVAQMDRLIQDLLDVKRIEAGFLSLDIESVQVRPFIERVLDSFTPIAAARSIDLQRGSIVDDTLMADHERLSQVFSNLVGNAVKFTAPGGRVTVGVRRSPAAMEFLISDTGPGIPAENLPHVFDRFWQARRTGRHGIGLGLAIVKGIIDAHGGSIDVASELGVGTTFTVSLPHTTQ